MLAFNLQLSWFIQHCYIVHPFGLWKQSWTTNLMEYWITWWTWAIDSHRELKTLLGPILPTFVVVFTFSGALERVDTLGYSPFSVHP